jgi:hypothetical protein
VTRITISTAQFSTLQRVIQSLVRTLRRLALVAALAVIPIALLFRRDGFDSLDAIVSIALLAPSVIVLLFVRGVLQVVSLPDRFRRMPGEGQERVTELARIAGDARTIRPRSAPLLLWRLRGSIGSIRDVAGIALPLRIFTPGFLTVTAFAAFGCLILACAGLIALIVLAAG